ncbi:outer membrane beta-barrel protein [Longimicrobium sp.]|uniref:outer membrane beta-barrel protein n=1 Tax=Longimicrobium sp. TaxID=2029185 RepID=UPI002BF944CB|nr:outer membrane beta-barrel protein [Longimicrobium sp.]HSU16857.1 outer membrane beta-barrel protein [Longimicrobium sp.]
MKKTTCGFLAAVAALVVAGSASAQRIPLSIEGRVDAAIPTGDLGDAANVGIGLHGDVTFNVTPIVGVYGGYSWNRFGAKDTNGVDYTDQGFDVGIKATFAPMQGLGAAPFFRGGAIIHKLSASASDDDLGDFTISSDSKVGFEVAGGVAFPIAPRIMLTPQVGYTQFNAADEGDDDATVSVVHAGAGISISF